MAILYRLLFEWLPLLLCNNLLNLFYVVLVCFGICIPNSCLILWEEAVTIGVEKVLARI